MSAYIEPKTHIATLARWASVEKKISSYYNPITKKMISHEEERNELYKIYAQLLEKQNVESVNARYEEETTLRKYESYSEGLAQHEISREEVLSAIQGYSYQACESENWHESDAYWLLNSLKQALVNDVIEVADATCWEIEDSRLDKERSTNPVSEII